MSNDALKVIVIFLLGKLGNGKYLIPITGNEQRFLLCT